MAITQATMVLTVKSLTDVQGPDGIAYKFISGRLAADTGTTKLLFNGGGGFYGTSRGSNVGFYMKASGAGTLPAAGDTINVVVG